MTPRLLKNNDSNLNYNIILAIGILFIHTEAQQIPLVRLPSNTLLKYTAYKDVSILHFGIPSDTRTAYFSFKAYEESKSAFRKFLFLKYHVIYDLLIPSMNRERMHTQKCFIAFESW